MFISLRTTLRISGVQRVRQQDPEPLPPHWTPGTKDHWREPTSAPHSRRHLHDHQVQKGKSDHFCLGNSKTACSSATMQGLQSSQRKWDWHSSVVRVNLKRFQHLTMLFFFCVHCLLQGVVYQSDFKKDPHGPRADVHGDQCAHQDWAG